MTVFEKLALSGIALLVRMGMVTFTNTTYPIVAVVDNWIAKTDKLFDVEVADENNELFKLTPMDTINIKYVSLDDRGCFNPFNVDKFSAGKLICKDVYMMFRTAGEEELSEAYFINIRTGQRQGLTLNKEKV